MKKLIHIILILALILPSITFSARTDGLWNNKGTYMKPIPYLGLDVLIYGISKYLNFGATSGSTGYGFRDNSGTMQYKNSGGSWGNFGGGAGGTGSNWQYETNFGANALTPTSTIPVWFKDPVYASSTIEADGSITTNTGFYGDTWSSATGNSMNIKPSGDEDDFLSYKTIANRPTTKIEGGPFHFWESSSNVFTGISMRKDADHSGSLIYYKLEDQFGLSSKDPLVFKVCGDYDDYVKICSADNIPELSVASSSGFKINAGGTNSLLLNHDGGNVGIATSTPDYPLSLGWNKELALYSDQENDAGELIYLHSMTDSAKATIAYEDYLGDTVAWLTAHYKSSGGSVHEHFSIETSDTSKALQTRIGVPYNCDYDCQVQINQANLKITRNSGQTNGNLYMGGNQGHENYFRFYPNYASNATHIFKIATSTDNDIQLSAMGGNEIEIAESGLYLTGTSNLHTTLKIGAKDQYDQTLEFYNTDDSVLQGFIKYDESAKDLFCTNSITGTNSDLIFTTGTEGETMRIKGSGYVGIATSSPAYPLDVYGNTRIDGTLKIGAYTLPSTDGTADQYLKTNGSGAVAWGTVAGGGDITQVFDCADGDCNTMTVGTSEYLTYGTGYIDANRFAGVTTVSGTEFGYLNDVSSAIQTQFSNKQPLEATLTDIADGTIAENLVNTANPWADNEVSDTLTVTGYMQDTDIDTFAELQSWAVGYTDNNTTYTGGTNLTLAGTVFNVDDSFLLNTGDTGTGVYNFGGATSLEIPNASAPVVDTLGEIGLDTTDDQIIVMGATAKVIPTKFKIWSATIASTSPAFISGGLLAVPVQLDGYTMTEIRCKVDGGTSKVIAVEDASANTTEDIVCGLSVTSDDGSITNATVTAAEEMYLDFGASDGAVNTVSISVFGLITRE